MKTHFQTFENRGGPEHTAERIQALRQLLKKQKLDGFIISRSDEHLNEYVSPHDERLLWATGFSGSAGLAIILKNTAAIFIDGRYTLQVRSEVNQEIITPHTIPQTTPTEWLKQHAKKATRIGIDPKLHGIANFEAYNGALEQVGAKLISLAHNPIDTIWQQQPPKPENPVIAHPKKYAGIDVTEKIKQIQSALKEKKIDAFVAVSPESICWLFNLRGKDIPRTPIMLANAIIHAKAKPELFLNHARMSNRAKEQLKDTTRLQAPENFTTALKTLGAGFKKVLIDPDRTNSAIYQTLRASRAEIVRGSDPIALPKAKKNKAEIEGTKTAHIRDGIAICRFLHWLEESQKNPPENEPLSEISAAIALEQFRIQTEVLKDISFETISGSGPNGAIVHYRVSKTSNRLLKSGELYLVDSGAQYKDGTTDITRTIAIGPPTNPMRRHYTLVLKAHIGLSLAHFPQGTRGVDLDPLVRAPLWQAGLDFNHGTGHGVGSFLSVHEGPQAISKRAMVPLEPGMILSNEPGYYREGAYGIRLENLVLVKEPENIPGGEQPMMSFETLTLAPFDKNLIDINLLTERELKWLNAYHRTVWKTISKNLKAPEKSWLKRSTSPL